MRNERFLNTPFAVGGADEIATFIAHLLERRGPIRVILHGNAHTLHLAAYEPDLRQVAASPATMLLFEGIALKLARLFTYGEWWPDVNGTDLVPCVLSQLRGRPLRLALIGGRPGVAGVAARSLASGLNNLEVVATFDGFGDRSDEGRLLEALERAQADLVLVGLGTPLQERCAAVWATALPQMLFWAVGGLFDYHAGQTVRAPLWLRRMRLEWAWRIAQEPARLWDRYFVEAFWLARTVIKQPVPRPQIHSHRISKEFLK
jgi:exopolysaccharide biosynthesis WecB/TagA/CpsF family protein